MNKKGHVALAALAGTAMLYSSELKLADSALLAIVACGASLLPDLDHKTGTISNKIQFSAKVRRKLRVLSGLLVGVGILLYLLHLGLPLLWVGAGVSLAAAARIRTLLLSGGGLAMIGYFIHYNGHWLILLTGLALLVVPFVQHRGIIHSPEFAALLTLAIVSFTGNASHIVEATGLGIIVGWWSHLLGDALTQEGVHSVFLPRLKVALKIVRNGGTSERWVIKGCWAASFVIWILAFQ